MEVENSENRGLADLDSNVTKGWIWVDADMLIIHQIADADAILYPFKEGDNGSIKGNKDISRVSGSTVTPSEEQPISTVLLSA